MKYAALCLILMTIAAGVERLPGQVSAKDRKVVVISLDGFPAGALGDPALPIPTLRSLMKTGAQAKRMTTVNPTVTWPNHTSMVTGVYPPQHGLFVNGTLVRGETGLPVRVDPFIPKEKMVHATTVYDLAQRSGMTTAQVDWVAIEKAPTITWAFPEMPSANGAIEQEMMARGLVQKTEIEQFTKLNIVRRDQIWTDAAIEILNQHSPNLLLVHFLTLDTTHHTYGPGTTAAKAAMGFLDGCVARISDAVRNSSTANQTTILIVSDHGFKAVTHQIHADAAVAAAGLKDGVQILPEGGTALVYFDKRRRAQLLPKVGQEMSKVEGVARVVGKDGFGELHLPDPDKEVQAPDLVLVAKNGYSFSNGADGPVVVTTTQPTGSHGYLNSDPELDAILIASGYGIRPGAVVDRVRNLDVAPTIASLLGLSFGDVGGRAITEILR
jgi:predicted AlkP superfamily pyrophosphatase or phosphodiesterase